MHDVIRYIEQAEPGEIDVLIDTVINRYKELFPDWEIVYYAHPKEDFEEGKSTWELVLEHLNDR